MMAVKADTIQRHFKSSAVSADAAVPKSGSFYPVLYSFPHNVYGDCTVVDRLMLGSFAHLTSSLMP